MDNFYLSAVVRELSPVIVGRRVVSIISTGSDVRIDLKLHGRQILFASLDRSEPALFLSTRSNKKKNDSLSAAPFAVALREHLTGALLGSLLKNPQDRVVCINFKTTSDSGDHRSESLLLDLRGRSANAVLRDQSNNAIASLHPVDEGYLEAISACIEGKQGLGEPEPTSTSASVSKFLSSHLRAELTARSDKTNPSDPLESLIKEIEHGPLEPSIYTVVPIEEFGRRLIDLRNGIVLAQIKLLHAERMHRYVFDTLSEAADAHFDALVRARQFNESFRGLRRRLSQEINRQSEVMRAVEADRARFADPARFRRAGDLLLANLNNARVEDNIATVIDYFDENQSEVKIDLPQGATLQQAAADYFNRYQKASRALTAIESRSKEVTSTLSALRQQLEKIDEEPTDLTLEEVRRSLRKFGITQKEEARGDSAKSKRTKARVISGRRFKSSDGYEIVVGRNDRENDEITFRVSKSNDIWLHAADYPGSHVIVRNHARTEIPHRTITEAAELAALNSQAKRAQKVAVHYTLRKFVSKPPKAKPGLVRLSSFKTVMVEPRCRVDKFE